MKRLEDRTLWDLTTNESPFVLIGLGILCFILAAMYSVINVYYWIKFHTWRRRGG